jgi:hypothetical protein
LGCGGGDEVDDKFSGCLFPELELELVVVARDIAGGVGVVVVVAESLPEVEGPVDGFVTALYMADMARLDEGRVGYELRYLSASREYFIASIDGTTCNNSANILLKKKFDEI